MFARIKGNKTSYFLVTLYLLSLFLNSFLLYHYSNEIRFNLYFDEKLIFSFVTAVSSIILAFITFSYLKATKGILNENTKQREFLESPYIYVSIEPDKEQNNFFFVKIRNTGNSTAYNIVINFSNDIFSITSKKINDFYLFRRIPALGKNEEISFFLSDAKSLLHKKNTKTVVYINYYKSPNTSSKCFKDSYEIDLDIYKDLLQLKRPTNTDIFEEMKSLKEALLLNLVKDDKG